MLHRTIFIISLFSARNTKDEVHSIEEVVTETDLQNSFPILPPYSQQIKSLKLVIDSIQASFEIYNFKNLQELDINAPISKTILANITRFCPLLQVLQLHGSKEPHPEEEDMIDLFSNCTKLVRITLEKMGCSWKSGGLTANFLNNINEHLPKLEYLNLKGIAHKKIEIDEPYEAHEAYQLIFDQGMGRQFVAMTTRSHQEATEFMNSPRVYPTHYQQLKMQTIQVPAGTCKKLVDADEPKITNDILRDIARKYDHDIVIVNPNGRTIKKSMMNEDLEEL